VRLGYSDDRDACAATRVHAHDRAAINSLQAHERTRCALVHRVRFLSMTEICRGEGCDERALAE
jgi:hypothetical protein